MLISFSVTRTGTLSHSVPRYYTSRSCTKSQLGNWPTCIRPDLNPGLLLGRQLCYHYTCATIHDGQEIKLEDLIRRAAQTSILDSHCMLWLCFAEQRSGSWSFSYGQSMQRLCNVPATTKEHSMHRPCTVPAQYHMNTGY